MGGRQAQIKVNKCWGGKEISCRNECLRWAESLHAPVHYHHYHPGCLRSHRSNQPWRAVIKRIHCALHKCSCWATYNNTQLHLGGCCPHRSHYQSGQAAAGVNLQGEDSQLLCFDGFCLWVEKYSVFFENRHYYYKGNGDEMKVCLRAKLCKTICGEDNISEWDLREYNFVDHKIHNIKLSRM